MPTLSEVVPLYIKLRDRIDELEKAHKAAMKPLNEKLELMDTWLLGELQKANQQSVAIKGAGTVFQLKKSRCNVTDFDKLLEWCMDNQRFDILTKGVAKTVVAEYVEANQEAPPGVNYQTFMGVQVNRERGT